MLPGQVQRAGFGSRRLILAGLGASVIGPALGGTAARFRFGLTPVFLTSDLDLLDALQTYLARAMGMPVELVLKRTYQEITSQLVAGLIDAAWICGYPFVAYRSELALVAVPIWRGRTAYQSYLLVNRSRPADTLDGLQNDVHAFSDPDSNSGYLVTRALLAERRRRPQDFFRRTFFTHGHRNVVRAVSASLADSGSVDGYVWEVMTETEPQLTAGTRPIWRSDWMGFPPVATTMARRDDEAMQRLRQALLDMPADATGRKALGMLRLDGFAEGDPKQFDSIAARLETVRSQG